MPGIVLSIAVVDFTAPDAVLRIKKEVDHPIVDGDGHLVELLPVVLDFVREIGGPAIQTRFVEYLGAMFDAGWGFSRVKQPFWGSPAGTVDRLTSALPALMYQRLDEFGLDFALLYPGIGLPLMACADDEIRQVATRAINTYYAEVYGPFADRMMPTAIIPMFTPGEAIAELDHAVGVLGLKAVVMTGVVPRATRADGVPAWIDTLGHDSDFDYDPVWARCEELGVAPAFHGIGFGWGSRTSRTNYVYNHLGNFAAAQEAICRSLIMGGVTQRFPDLRFAFLEGGVTWACQLYSDLLGHWEKRNGESILRHDPAAIDLDLASELIAQFGTGRLAEHAEAVKGAVRHGASSRTDRAQIDEFAESEITGPADVTRIFEQQLFFGCEADDPLNALAFSPQMLPNGARVNAFFGSDIGHWDVPDMRAVLPEAWEAVDDGHLTHDDFRAFTYGNVVRMLTDVNPQFFANTVIDDLEESR